MNTFGMKFEKPVSGIEMKRILFPDRRHAYRLRRIVDHVNICDLQGRKMEC